MFRYETHLHTAEASACSSSCAADMADRYKAEGYDGIIVTDHFYNGNTCVDRSLPWEEWVEGYCKGYEHAKARGDEIGLDVFFGIEYGDGASDFLIYGLDKEWYKSHEGIMDLEMTRFLELVRSEGAFVVHAHPFRECDYIRGWLHCPLYVDAIETVNASHKDPRFNERADIYADWFGLPKTGGSDSHNTTDRYYGGGVLSPTRFSSVEDYTRAVRSGELTIIGK